MIGSDVLVQRSHFDLSLGHLNETVLHQLRQHHAGRHIPYRDSKLTRILQPSLGGSGRTAIICTISMQQVHCEESHNTLEFATRAKRVVNTVSAKETMTSAALLKRQAKEIDKLKDQLRDKGCFIHTVHLPSFNMLLCEAHVHCLSLCGITHVRVVL